MEPSSSSSCRHKLSLTTALNSTASLPDDSISSSAAARHLAVNEERQLQDLGVGDGAGEVGRVEDGDEVAVLVLVLQGDVVLGRELAAVDPLGADSIETLWL